MLPADWNWWRIRLPQPSVDGQCYTVQYDHPTDIHEASILFDGDGEIVDPPAFHLTYFLPEFQDISFSDPHVPDRTLMMRGPTAEFDVVWNDAPGEMWDLLPGNTCCPGDYSIEEVQRDRQHVQYGRNERWADSTRREFSSSMGYLHWPTNPPQTRRIGRPEPPSAYTARPRWQSRHPPSGPTPNEIRQREGLPPAPDYLGEILRACQTFEAAQNRRPVAIVMHPQDQQRLLSQVDAAGPMTMPTPTGLRPHGTLFGIEIRLDQNLQLGQILLIGAEGDTMPQEVRNWGGDLIGVLQEPGVRPRPSVIRGGRSPNVLPESEVIAEIDRLEDYFDTRDEAEAAVRLVNEQVRGGPVDDYHANRYPECDHCPHQWHGLECEHCDCINTDWLQEGTK
jgi:hypothetical protein